MVDECTGPGVARWRVAQGHLVFSVYDEAPGADDVFLLQKAFNESWIVISNDKDFGELVYRQRLAHHGIVLLGLSDERTPAKIAALDNLFKSCADRLADAFVVVDETQTRISAS